MTLEVDTKVVNKGSYNGEGWEGMYYRGRMITHCVRDRLRGGSGMGNVMKRTCTRASMLSLEYA